MNKYEDMLNIMLNWYCEQEEYQMTNSMFDKLIEVNGYTDRHKWSIFKTWYELHTGECLDEENYIK